MVVIMRRGNPVLIFFILLVISLLIFGFSRTNFSARPNSFLYSFGAFLSRPSYSLLNWVTSLGGNSKIDELKKENLVLTRKIVDQQALLAENKSLHDQFQTASPKSLDLMPALVVGAPRFLPGVTSPETFVINVGKKDGVKMGSAVVFKDNLVGKISKISDYLSEVMLVTNPDSKFAAKTTNGVLGIVRGEGNQDMILDNVLLSDTLARDNVVVTSGDLTVDLANFSPNLIVGKITSVDKSPNDIFQRGKIQSLLDFSKLTDVFVLINVK